MLLAEEFGPSRTIATFYDFYPMEISLDSDDGSPASWLLKPGESGPLLQVPLGTGKSSILDLLKKERFDPFVTNPPFLPTSEREYRRAVKEAMRAESKRRGGKFKPSPEYRTMDEFLDAMLRIYEHVMLIGWMGNVPPEDSVRIIIESLAGGK